MLSVCSFTLLTHRPNCNLLADDLPTNDPGAVDEEEHEDRAPPKEDKDRKELGVGLELFSSDRIFFLLRRSIERAGRTLNVRGNSSVVKKLRRRRENLALPEVQPHYLFRPLPLHLSVLQLQDPQTSLRRVLCSPWVVRPSTFLIRWSKPNLLIDNDPPASDAKVVVEERREYHPPPAPLKEDEDRKGLGVGLNCPPPDGMFFSPHHSVKRAERTLDARENWMALKRVQRLPPRNDRLTVLEVQPRQILEVMPSRPPILWLQNPRRAVVTTRLSPVCLVPALDSTSKSHSILYLSPPIWEVNLVRFLDASTNHQEIDSAKLQPLVHQ